MGEVVAGSFLSGYEPYWRRSTEEIEGAIKSNVIVLDTNALVNLYRMAAAGREEYFAVLAHVSKRLWVPRQVVDEFHKVRLSAVAAHISGLRTKSTAVSEAAETLQAALKDFARLYSLAEGRVAEYMKPLDSAISGILAHVRKDVEGFDLDPGHLASSDPIMDRLAGLLEGRVGLGISIESLPDALKEAERRGKEKIPPGFKDWEQKGADGVGDYLIWREMVEYAKSTDKGVLFVSSDIKDDWFRRQAGFVIGPRPELVKEMKEEAGSDYHHLTLADFLSTASRALGVFVSSNTISHAKELERDRERIADVSSLKVKITSARNSLKVSKDRYARLSEVMDDVHRRVMEGEWHVSRMKESLKNDRISDEDLEALRLRLAETMALLQRDKLERAELRREAARLSEEVQLSKTTLWAYEASLAELSGKQ
ncbi:PIN-like domain-containing protein [Streptomyces sp. NPDC003514]